MECADQHVPIVHLLKEIFVFKHAICLYKIHNAFPNAMMDTIKVELFVLSAKVNVKPVIPI